jgi:hypothetical protein
MRTLITIAAAGLLVAVAGTALAAEGDLTVTDGRQTVTLDRDDLAGMKQDVIETTTPWTKGKIKVSGPAFTSVLQEAGLAGDTVSVVARDGYKADIPRAKLTADGAILAMSLNDAPLPADKAPYWIVFPYDKSPEIGDAAHQSWSAWAIDKLTLK